MTPHRHAARLRQGQALLPDPSVFGVRARGRSWRDALLDLGFVLGFAAIFIFGVI